MVTIEINGIKVEAEEGQMLIKAADEAGIEIPRFCYHKNLSIAASCRMCLVEVEKAPKPVPACATPVSDGMVVHTKSTAALAAQKSVMEFLLINHPLDCPVCDQGGECELQDISMGYGSDVAKYAEMKRVVQDKDIGPLVATDLTRCIHCTRCVRFGQEIAGMRELGATGRGEWMEIGTFIEKSLDSELSGNIIDLCPVGALTSKPFRFSARPWELVSNETIAAHDCVGSNINIQTKDGVIKRVIARENEAVNETWISDRDRFSYEGINADDRLLKPMLKRDGEWQEASWDEALQFAANGLKEIVDQHTASQLGALCSPSSTTEEHYLLQKLVRGIGSNNIDHRLRQIDTLGQAADPYFLSLGMEITELGRQQGILLIGSNVRKEQPMIAHQIRKASLNGTSVMMLNPAAFDCNFKTSQQLVTTPAEFFKEMKALAKAATDITGTELPAGLAALTSAVKVTDEHNAVINTLKDVDNAIVILGTIAQAMPHYAGVRMLASYIAGATGARLGYLTEGANAAGACLAGVLPHRDADRNRELDGLDTQAMLSQPLKAYIIQNIEPEFDIENPVQALNALQQAEFVVSLTPYVSETMKAYADVLLPIATANETSGTLVNIAGMWQSFNAAAKTPGDVKPGWKVLRVLGNLFDIKGFEYMTSEEVLGDLQHKLEGQVEIGSPIADNLLEWQCPENISAKTAGLQRITEVSMYHVDSVSRRATALQQTHDAHENVRINSSLAAKLQIEKGQQVTITQGNNAAEANITIDDSITDNCVYIAAGTSASASLGSSFDTVELTAK